MLAFDALADVGGIAVVSRALVERPRNGRWHAAENQRCDKHMFEQAGIARIRAQPMHPR